MESWRRLLNLSDWRVIHNETPTKNMAEVYDFKDEDKIVRYRFGSDWAGHKITHDALEAVAIHEMLHIRLHPLIEAVSGYGKDTEEANRAEHEIIIVLEDLLLKLSNFAREHKE